MNAGIRTGLGGKSLVDLEKEVGGTDNLPPHSFKPGDIVSIEEYNPKSRREKKTQNAESTIVSGVVYKVSDQVVTLSFGDEVPDLFSGRCNMYLIHFINQFYVIYYQRIW